MFKVHDRVRIINVSETDDPVGLYNGKTGYIFKIWNANGAYPYEIAFDDGSVSWCFEEHELVLIDVQS